MKLHNWLDIACDFKDAVILGNGASAAIDERFLYPNLWDAARGENLISDRLQEIANELNTGHNFELLLRQLWTAETVDEQFDIDAEKIQLAYAELRNALITTVQTVHCKQSDVIGRLRDATLFLQRFKTVFSLNYDLTLYWLMMASNDVQKSHIFKDCFNRGKFSPKWPNFRESIRGRDRVTLVFYPHGALQLVQTIYGISRKICRDEQGNDLLNCLQDHWQCGSSSLPLFVSEGESRCKLRSIRRSDYLSTVYYEILPTCGPSLVIYGWSMNSEVDEHLLRQIGAGRYVRVAVSVYKPTTDDVDKHIKQTNELFRMFQIPEPKFFDAESPGAWINATPEEPS